MIHSLSSLVSEADTTVLQIVRAERTHSYCMQELLCNRSVCWMLCNDTNRKRQSGVVMRRSGSEALDGSILLLSGCIVCMVLL
jgi:hypothetical protein